MGLRARGRFQGGQSKALHKRGSAIIENRDKQMIENIAKFCVELEAVFEDGGLKQMYNDFRNAGEEVAEIYDALKREAQESGGVVANSAYSGFSSLKNGLEDFFNFTSESFGKIDDLIKSVWDNMVSSFAQALSKMAANNLLSAIFGGGGGLLGGLFGGLLGSRRSGGPIEETGPYYLHAGEFVLPPEVVSSIQGGGYNPAPAYSGGAGAGNISVTLNTPVTFNGAPQNSDVRKICEEISNAARRGVSWAVEQAKISYKIGRDRSSESSL